MSTVPPDLTSELGGVGAREDVALRDIHIVKLEGSVDQVVDVAIARMSLAPPTCQVRQTETGDDAEQEELAGDDNIRQLYQYFQD